MRPWLIIKTHVAKLKIWKSRGRKSQWKRFIRHRNKQNFCSSQFYAPSTTRWWNRRKYKFFEFKAKKVFNLVHKLAEAYVKCNGHNVEPVHLFLSSGGGTCKSHLLKVIHNAISKNIVLSWQRPWKTKISFTWTHKNISSKYR